MKTDNDNEVKDKNKKKKRRKKLTGKNIGGENRWQMRNSRLQYEQGGEEEEEEDLK